MLDRRSAACTGAMAGIYRRLLEIIAADPAAVLRGRISLSGREKALVAVKALAGRMSVSPRAVVIGGGLAGITAAIALAEAGAQVTLLEARPRLGGATCSFSRDGLTVDTGQHVFLGCCSAYRGLLGQLGMTAHAPLQDRFDVTVLAPSRSASSGGDPRPPAGVGSAGPRSPAPCICCPPWPGTRSCRGPNGPWYPAPPWPCASSTRPSRRWTSSASATGSPPAARTTGPAAPCGTCSPSRP